MGTNDWILSLERRLSDRLPGRTAHRRLAPSLAYGRHTGPPAASAKPAAVALLLYPTRQGEWRFPLTVRPQHMKAHAGQVCLPGGVVECRESPELCAIREAEEELGISAGDLRRLGNLSPIYVFGTNFLMQPVVFVADRELEWHPSPAEVDHVLEMPLREFLRLPEPESVPMERDGLRFRSPAWKWQDVLIWGATAMVLAEWQEILQAETSLGCPPA